MITLTLIEQLDALDKALFIFLNGLHADWLDPVMVFVSGKLGWVPLYVFLLYLLIRAHQWNAVYVLLGIGLMITLSDQFTSGFMKPYFERLRPCRNEALSEVIYLLSSCNSRYGFASSHASNSFAVAVFCWLLLPARHGKWARWLVLWAALVAYSRVYLGVHYPGDIIVGALVGVLAALIVVWLVRFAIRRKPLQKPSPSS